MPYNSETRPQLASYTDLESPGDDFTFLASANLQQVVSLQYTFDWLLAAVELLYENAYGSSTMQDAFKVLRCDAHATFGAYFVAVHRYNKNTGQWHCPPVCVESNQVYGPIKRRVECDH